MIPLLVIGGLAIYIMTPEERRRALDHIIRAVGQGRRVLLRSRTEPDPFDEALRARTRWPAVTMAIVGINAAVLVLISGIGVGSDPEVLVRSGASVGPLTTNGEWWRLITAAFVHAGMFHLLVDIAGFVQIAIVVERLAGHAALAVIYVTAGTLGTLAHLSTHPLAVTTASSPAVFGVYGAFLAAWIWGTLRRSPVSIPPRCARRVGPAVGLFVLYQLIIGGMGPAAAVALLAGLVGGLMVSPGIAIRRPSVRQVAVPFAVAAVIVIAMAIPLAGMADIRPEIIQVVALDQHTASAYETAVARFRNGRTSARELAGYIEDKIVPELKAARQRLNTLRGVPPQHQYLVAAAGKYLDLRDRSWRLRVTGLRESKIPLLQEADRVESAARETLRTLTTAIE